MGSCTAKTILDIMEGWKGLSRSNGTHKPIIDLYNSHKPLARGYTVTYYDAYCATTVSSAFIKANAVDLIGGTECGVECFIELFKKKGIWNEDGTAIPKPAWLIVYNWDEDKQPNDGFADHIGVVKSVDTANRVIICIEGNINGGVVAERSVPIGWGCIRGYAMPEYSDVDTTKKITKGIDISEWQDSVNYSALAKDIDQIILRSSRGTSTIDKMFLNHVKSCNSAGIPIAGVYHFIYAISKAEVKKNADCAVKFVKEAGLPKTTRIWCDLEYDTITKAKNQGVIVTAEDINEWTKIFCERIIEAGYPTGVYTNIDFYKNKYYQSTLKNYPIWLADYSGDPDYECIVHQYTSSGKVAGISESVDCNYFYEDVPVTEAPAKEPTLYYEKGKKYVLQNEMKVRKGPGTNYARVKYKDFTDGGKKADKNKNGCLDPGTRVGCKGVAKKGDDIWIKIRNGWIAAYYNGITYVK